MKQLSVIIITKNEASNIERCLQSVSWADEIIVVDSGSTDDTQAICQRYKVAFYTENWRGFGKQKNFALSKAKHEWVLSLDADECLSEPLQKEIKHILQQSEFDGYFSTVKLVFQNRVINHAVGSCQRLRLFRREKATFTDSEVHEVVDFAGKTGRTQGVIYHYSFPSIDRLIEKINLYSSLGANMKHKSGKKSGAWRATFAASWIFFRSYFLNGGFLDGKEGLILAFYFAEGAFYRYIKLSYL